ncbi:MAG: putative toxin-antitoxin system toxin component, PIN family [Pedosphaera sp. Tous-C6FEB]|nr:MAG: putative toxin-antitoxin system toxin component, PIN family [Pedosphaera sp. Tous-C6FEB]
MRVVLDTNVLVAASATPGVCRRLVEHCLLREAVILSEPILAELEEKLAGKFRVPQEEATRRVRRLAEEVALVEPGPLSAGVCRDSDDDAILATALAAEAEYLVTGDQDLLVLGRFGTARIVTPREFSEVLGLQP